MKTFAFALVLCIGAFAAAQVQAALPGLFYSATITQDVNATPAYTQLPISPLSLTPYTSVSGSPAVAWAFTQAGNYKLTGQVYVQGDPNAMFSFMLFWEYGTPGTYIQPTVTTPESFVAGALPNTAVYTVTVDNFYANVGDKISLLAAARPRTSGVTYTVQPKVLKGLGSTNMTLQAVP